MSHVTMTSRVAAVFAVAVLAWPMWAQDPNAKAAPKTYQVFTWNCSRSIQLVLATDNLSAAQEAVDKAKKTERNVRVTTGIQLNAFAVIREPKSYEVFVPGC